MDGELQVNGCHTTSMPMNGIPSAASNYIGPPGEAAIDLNGMLGFALPDYSGWGEFASMVSSAPGNLDAFLNDDSFRL